MGKRNFISGLVSLIFSLALTGQNTLTGYEWWFDDDIETAVHTSIAPSFVFEMNETFPVNGLESGLHSFHIRFFDDSLRSSPLISRFFFIAHN